jgi:adenylate cyclase class 2
VGKEEIAPPLGHHPGAGGEGPGTVICLADDFCEPHDSRLSLVKGLETEIKIEVLSFRGFRKRLKEAGFRIKHRRVFERNTIFETSPPTLRPSGCLVRLREAGSKYTITYKGPATVGKHKSREEVEFTVSDVEAAYTFLTRLGYLPGFVYEKYRTEYADIGSNGVVTLDETPIGLYAELEGEEKWIDSTAKTLGIADTEYLTASYGALYLKWCEREGIDPGHMRFA